MIWEIAFFRPDAEKDCDAGAGSIPVEQAVSPIRRLSADTDASFPDS